MSVLVKLFKLLTPKLVICLFLEIIIWHILPSSAEGGIVGYRNYSQGAAGAGQSDAFTAQADDPSALYYNPAGLTQLHGFQMAFGSLFVGGHLEFENPSGVHARGDFGGSVVFPPPSHFYLTANLPDLGVHALGDSTIGLGVIPAFGIVSRFPRDVPFATAVVQSTLPLLNVKPTVAYKVNEQLSLAAGADIYTFASFLDEGQLELKFQWPGGAGIPAGSFMELNGTGTGAGFNVGMLYTPFRNEFGDPLVNVGLVYRSETIVPLEGQFFSEGNLIADASTNLVLPQSITGGIALWPIRDPDYAWKLELDVDWTDWESYNDQDFRLSTGTTLAVPTNWRESFVVMIGTEYEIYHPMWLPDWELAFRAGYSHSLTPIPDETFNPAIPGANKNGASIGLGFLCEGKGEFFNLVPCQDFQKGLFEKKGISLDLSYSVYFHESRTITENINPTVIGTYLTIVHQGAVTLTLRF